MRNVLYTLGVTGIVVGVAAYQVVRSLEKKEVDEEKRSAIKSANQKTRKFNKILMCCQLEPVMISEGISFIETGLIEKSNDNLSKLGNKNLYNILSFCEIQDLITIRKANKFYKQTIDMMLTDKNYLRNCVKIGFNEEKRGKIWLRITQCSEKATFEAKFNQNQSRKSLSFNKSNSKKNKIEQKQIELIGKDISRTLDKTFSEINDKEHLQKLEKTLTKYCLFDDDVGYVQGMNFLVENILCVFNENEAFNFLKCLMFEYDLRSMYFPFFPRLKLSIYQFRNFMNRFCPDIHFKFRKIGIKYEMFASEWFMTIFSHPFLKDFAKRAMDMFLIDGWPAMHALGIILLRRERDKLLRYNFDDTIFLLKKLQIKNSELNGIIEEAFALGITVTDLDFHHRNFVDKRLYLNS